MKKHHRNHKQYYFKHYHDKRRGNAKPLKSFVWKMDYFRNTGKNACISLHSIGEMPVWYFDNYTDDTVVKKFLEKNGEFLYLEKYVDTNPWTWSWGCDYHYLWQGYEVVVYLHKFSADRYPSCRIKSITKDGKTLELFWAAHPFKRRASSKYYEMYKNISEKTLMKDIFTKF